MWCFAAKHGQLQYKYMCAAISTAMNRVSWAHAFVGACLNVQYICSLYHVYRRTGNLRALLGMEGLLVLTGRPGRLTPRSNCTFKFEDAKHACESQQHGLPVPFIPELSNICSLGSSRMRLSLCLPKKMGIIWHRQAKGASSSSGPSTSQWSQPRAFFPTYFSGDQRTSLENCNWVNLAWDSSAERWNRMRQTRLFTLDAMMETNRHVDTNILIQS